MADRRNTNPLDRALSVGSVARELNLPESGFIKMLVQPPLKVEEGRVLSTDPPELPTKVESALQRLGELMVDRPFGSPTKAALQAMGLEPAALAAAHRLGRVIRLADDVILLPDALLLAEQRLAHLNQPFTVSAARQTFATSRRVTVPLLEELDRREITRRLSNDQRKIVSGRLEEMDRRR
jgi:selenocysteine-specific elongation factor